MLFLLFYLKFACSFFEGKTFEVFFFLKKLPVQHVEVVGSNLYVKNKLVMQSHHRKVI